MSKAKSEKSHFKVQKILDKSSYFYRKSSNPKHDMMPLEDGFFFDIKKLNTS